MTTGKIREAVAVFEDADSLEAAVVALESHGFDRAAFSVLADEATVEEKLGHRYRSVREMEDEPAAPRETFFTHVSRAEAEYGLPLGLAAVAGLALAGVGGLLPLLVAVGGGAALGSVLGQKLHQHHAQRMREQMARGGLLLWVNVRNEEEEKAALEILGQHSAHDLHVHDIAA